VPSSYGLHPRPVERVFLRAFPQSRKEEEEKNDRREEGRVGQRNGMHMLWKRDRKQKTQADDLAKER